MFNSKVIVAAAVVGFLLSFFTGLFSGVGFAFVLLRAIIFAVVLALLASGIMIVFERFLDIGSAETTSYPTEVNVGSMVDVTVGVDDLPEEDSAPGFYVDTNLTSKSSKENVAVSDSSTVSAIATNSVSSSTNETLVSGVEDVNKQKVNESKSSHSPVEESGFVKSDIQSMTSSSNYNYDKGSSDDELDDLPNFNSVVKDVTTENSSYKDSSSTIDMGVQDAEVMAQAIRTILSKDG